MATYLALLRGINVGPTTAIAMEGLRKLFEALGHEDVRTHLRTGNVVFSAGGRAASLAAEIEKRVAEDLGVPSTVMVLTAAQLKKIVDANPLAGGSRDAAKLHVTFLSEAPERDRVCRLDRLPAGGEEFAVVGSAVYLHCPDGYGRTRLSNVNVERALGVRATTRTWRVVNTLLDMMRP